MIHYRGTHCVLRNFKFSCESVRLIKLCIVKKVTPMTFKVTISLINMEGEPWENEVSTQWYLALFCVSKNTHKSSLLSSTTTGQALMLKYWVLITVSWHGRILRPTLNSPAQKPFMMCHPLQGLIKKDKRQEVITIVQSKSYFKGGNEAQVLFCFYSSETTTVVNGKIS